MQAARNSNFPKNKKLEIWFPGLKRRTLAGQPGALGPPPAPYKINLPRPGAVENLFANSKRVAVAAKCVSRDDSFCNSTVSGQMETSAKTIRNSDKAISPISSREDPP